ncbi:hypothetical protein [Hansschlegelia beijingensis]|uniref:Cell wall anchor protein n=1 Tax=Hansschlegelia beijingensis TaxID=1133344 RepID=A0A7W6GF62_9HYPH|nr:hypothetical protein [Hansschlegelia beijingensis]MBB3972798.1 hypothetical protein [Hansschlegelia beijingensis]
MKTALRAAAFGLLALSLAGCSVSDASTTTPKTFDAICASEPAVYAAYVTVASTRGASAKKLATAAAAHKVVSDLCAAPPANLAQGVAQAAAAYATIMAARAEAARQAA